MTATDLLHECDRLGVRLCRHGNRVIYSAPADVLTAELLARLKAHKPDLLAALPDAEITKREVIHFRLPDHPPNGWATLVGRPGETRTDLMASLIQRWPTAEVRT